MIPPNDARKHRPISQVIPAFLLDVGPRLTRAAVVQAGHRGPVHNWPQPNRRGPAGPPGGAINTDRVREHAAPLGNSTIRQRDLRPEPSSLGPVGGAAVGHDLHADRHVSRIGGLHPLLGLRSSQRSHTERDQVHVRPAIAPRYCSVITALILRGSPQLFVGPAPDCSSPDHEHPPLRTTPWSCPRSHPGTAAVRVHGTGARSSSQSGSAQSDPAGRQPTAARTFPTALPTRPHR